MKTVSTDWLKQEFIKAVVPTTFGLSLSLTEQCNFRCTYCYESFELQRMSDAKYEGLKKFISEKMPNLKVFHLQWFGGEPLLEWKRTVDFGEFCQSITKKYDVIMPEITMPTNAWLLNTEVVDALVKSGTTKFMISLDGLPEEHNKTRVQKDGSETFNRVYSNLLEIKSSKVNFNIVLRLHIHKDNLESQILLSKKLHQDFSADKRFVVTAVCLGDFGGPSVKAINLLSSKENLVSEIKKLVQTNFRPEDAVFEDGPIEVCYAAKPNFIFIRPNGQIAKCTSALDRPDNDIGMLMDDGSITFNEKKAMLWSFGFQTQKEEDLTCPFFTKPQVEPIVFHKKLVA